MSNRNEQIFELENRYCPICGEYIKVGSLLHRCDEKILEEINEQNEIEDNIYDDEIEERTYGEKLEEFEDIYSDKEEDKEKEEEEENI
jgi:hypothetical protein